MPVTPELSEYVEKARKAGMPDAVIRDELLKIGWQSADIETLLPLPAPMPPQPEMQTPFQGGPVSEAISPEERALPPQMPPMSQTPVMPVETPQGQPQQPQNPTPVRRHSYIPFIITITVLLLVGGAIYYFLPQIVTQADKLIEKVMPSDVAQDEFMEQLPLVPVDETAGWQTYRNEEYGFEFKQPLSWIKVDIDGYTSDKYTVFVKDVDAEEYILENQKSGAVEGDARAVLGMDTQISIWIKDLPEWEQYLAMHRGYQGTFISEENIGGNLATRIFMNVRFGGGSQEAFTFVNNRNAVSISALYSKIDPGDEELVQILRGIVESFQFLSQATSTTP